MDCGGGDTPPDSYWFDCVFAGMRWTEQKKIFDSNTLIRLNEDTYRIQCEVKDQSNYSLCFGSTFAKIVMPGGSTELRCDENCASKVNVAKRMVVTCYCKAPWCKDVRPDWSFYKVDTGGTTIPVSEKIINKGMVSAILKENSLEENTAYKILATSSPQGSDFKDISRLEFFTNSKPYVAQLQGGCTVSPMEGIALNTPFFFSCVGWLDEDQPLIYIFKYRINSGNVTFYEGPASNTSAMMPLGDLNKDFNLVVEMVVQDALGASDSIVKILNVSKPESLSVDEVDELLNTTDPKALQNSILILSAVDAANSSSKEKTQVKEKVMDKIVNVTVKTLVDVGTLAFIVDMATEDDEQVSPTIQDKSLTKLDDMVAFTSQWKNRNDDAGLVKEVGYNVLRCISNVMTVATNNVLKVNSDKGIANTKASLELTDRMGTVLLETTILGEEPASFKTEYFDMLVGKHRRSHERVQIVKDIFLPGDTDLFGNTSESLSTFGSQLINYPENPYNWDTSSKNITSSVVDFTLKTNKGTTIDVTGLKNPVELYIPRDDNATNTGQPSNFFVKPSENEAISQFHSISIQSDDVSLSLTITPSGDRSLVVYVSARERPTPSRYNFMTELPNITFCHNYQVSNCSREAYTFSISSAITGATGQHYVGIKLVKRSESVREQSEQLPLHLRSRRDSGSGNGGLKNCILTKAPPPTPVPPTELIRPVYDASTDVNYTMSVNVASCKYWSNKTNTWTSEGCKAGLKSVSDKIQCFCTHLSAFGGGFFVAPNRIDFDVVFARGIGNNYSVLATVCTIFALYFLCLIYARRADRKDHAKIIADVIVARDFSDTYQYQIYIRTGIWRRYGTSAKVGIVLYGENGCTDNIYLTDSKIQRKFFARASVNHFTLYLPESLGQLYKIELWHDDTGNNSSWFVEDVCIVDSQTTDEWHFIARQWLAVDKGEGELKVEIRAADEEQLKAVGNLTYTRAAKSFADIHLWFSIFTKPPHNKFTRCQRLSCCLSTLLAAMIANAMFYELGGSAEDTFKVGPLQVSWTQIKIGIQSSFVAVPVNVLLVLIFRYVKESKRYRYEEPTADKKTQHGCLPHFFVYIAWLLCLATAVTSAVFTVFYSIQWGKEKSNQWLTSILVSFFDDILVLQPLKIVLLASLVSMIIRKLPKREEIVGPSLWKRRKAHEISVSGAQKASLAFEERDHKKKLLKMHSKVKEITTFLVFVILLMIVCYGNRSETRYMVTRSLEETFGKFKDVGEPPEFWSWTRDTLVPGLYDSTWYNGRPFDKEGFISTREAFMIGMPRLRQIRVKPEGKCKNVGNYLVLQEMFERCLPLDMADNEDTTSQLPGWIPAPNNFQDSSLDFQELCPKPWKYLTAKELQTTSFYGQTYSYGGGGYVADLGYSSTSANEVIDILEENVWIDDRTAGVFVEFAVFEPSTSLITSVKYLYERLATGQTDTRTKVKTLTLYSPADPGLRSIYEVCQLLFILVICFMLFAEIVKLTHAQAAYFKLFWNWVELIEIASASSSLAMFFLKQKYTSAFVKSVHANPFETTSADYLVLWSDLEVALLSFVIFIVTIKLLRIIRFNRHVCQMMATLKRSSKPLVSFSAVFITALLGFSHLGYLVFGHNLEAYSTYGGTLASMLVMTLGGRMYYNELSSINSVIGPSFLFIYMVIIGCILVNLFVTILMDTYSDVRGSVSGDEDFSDADLGDFMADYIKKRIKGLQRKIVLWWKERSRKKEAEAARRRSSGGLVKLNAIRKKTLRGGIFQVEDFENVELLTVATEYATEVKHSGSPSTFMDSLSDLNLSTWHSILLMYAGEEIVEDLSVEEIVQCLSNHKNLQLSS